MNDSIVPLIHFVILYALNFVRYSLRYCTYLGIPSCTVLLVLQLFEVLRTEFTITDDLCKCRSDLSGKYE